MKRNYLVLAAFLFSGPVAVICAASNEDVNSSKPSYTGEDLNDPGQSTVPESKESIPAVGVPEKSASEIKPTAPPATEVIAEKLAIREALDHHDAPKATRLFNEALSRFPNDPDLREVKEAELLKRHAEKARLVFARALSQSANLFGKQWVPGQSMQDGETGLSLEETRTGARSGPRVALVEGYSLLSRGEPTRAEEVLTRALSHGESAPLYYARVMARGMTGNFKGADEDSIKAVALSREATAAVSQRALLMIDMGRREEALAWAQRTLKTNPTDPDALVVRSRVLWRDRAQRDQSLADLKEAARLEPKRYGDLYQAAQKRYFGQRALSELTQGDDRRALEDADRALAGNPNDAQAHMVRGMALEMMGRRDGALADMRRAAELDPRRFSKFADMLAAAKREGRAPLWSRAETAGR